MVYVLLCVFAVMGLVHRPQLLWRANRPFQRPFVKDYDATEPTTAGYTMTRIVGVVFLAVVAFMIFTQAT
ncbi:hypothetical protein G3I40_35310 [Streptomyces sp. SID14478]|uniref:DUF6199 family natural product biosynthesis protein n=1 Tax=Streptomyces sp. SID14478 TaxID=2706073 RepID=UPI0013DEA85A|nr:DUF6199 family natural product biosynthesis protein [Streptomyces sp. SID14478]NEB80442.1 hypothetical protein [Streptomyces sp. SID14478]